MTSTTGCPGTTNGSKPCFPTSPAFTGSNPSWNVITADLSSFAGQTASIRFHFCTDASVIYPGWYVDDVCVTTPTPAFSPTISGTPTISQTPTVSTTATASQTATETILPAICLPFTCTITPTFSPTFSPTATASATPTVSGTATRSGSSTESSTITPTSSVSPTALPTETPTPTPPETETPSATRTGSPSATWSGSPLPSGTATPDAGRLRISPNPVSASALLVRFFGLAPGDTVRIFDLAGARLGESRPDPDSGIAEWNLVRSDGRRVPSGLYLASAAGGKRTGIFAVVRH